MRSFKCSPVFDWSPRRDDVAQYVPNAVVKNMSTNRYKPARCSGWFDTPMGGPVRVTVVDPHSRSTLTREYAEIWYSTVARICNYIDEICGSDPFRPASIDMVIYLWNKPKRLSCDSASIDSSHANTGVTIHNPNGTSRILVYRKEEAVKTVIHELLHAFRFGDWANSDPELMRRVKNLAAGFGFKLTSTVPIRPTEALVDTMAIRIAVHLFRKCTWDDCVDYAKRVRNKLMHAFQGSDWVQSTHAFEYYVVKCELMTNIEQLMAAHLFGLMRPDKQKVRSLLPSSSKKIAKGKKTGLNQKSFSLRMTPTRLASLLT